MQKETEEPLKLKSLNPSRRPRPRLKVLPRGEQDKEGARGKARCPTSAARPPYLESSALTNDKQDDLCPVA